MSSKSGKPGRVTFAGHLPARRDVFRFVAPVRAAGRLTAAEYRAFRRIHIFLSEVERITRDVLNLTRYSRLETSEWDQVRQEYLRLNPGTARPSHTATAFRNEVVRERSAITEILRRLGFHPARDAPDVPAVPAGRQPPPPPPPAPPAARAITFVLVNPYGGPPQ